MLILALVIVLAALSVSLVAGIAFARRKTLDLEARTVRQRQLSSSATSFGHELFRRSLRIDAVLDHVRQARLITAGSVLEAEIEALCVQIEADAATQREALRHVAPLSGRARELALERVDPPMAELETAGTALRDLTTRVAADLAPTQGNGVSLERRARAIQATIDELETLGGAVSDLGGTVSDHGDLVAHSEVTALEPGHEPPRDAEPPPTSPS